MKITIKKKRIMKENQNPRDKYVVGPAQNWPPKVAVLFDGAGYARLGLEQAGFDCYGFELNPLAHWLSSHLGTKNRSVLADVRDVDLSSFDAVWASPPCQRFSAATQGSGNQVTGKYKDDLLEWSLSLPEKFPNIRVVWVENVLTRKKEQDTWGVKYNAAQFAKEPLQQRQRMIGGQYPKPDTFRDYKPYYIELSNVACPAITASEWKWSKNDKRRASRWWYKKYGRKPTWVELVNYMGLPTEMIPKEWYRGFEIFDIEDKEERREARMAFEDEIGWSVDNPGKKLTPNRWRNTLMRAAGNGVVVSMAQGLGEAAMREFQQAKEDQEELPQEQEIPNQRYNQKTGRWETQEPGEPTELQEKLFKQVGQGLFRTLK